MAKIKICGLTRMEDIKAVNEILPDYIGFVFAESRRRVDRDTAQKLKNALDQNIKAIGIFVNADQSVIIDLCKTHIIDIVQLHGDEDSAYIETLKKAISNPIIKAIRVQSTEQNHSSSNITLRLFTVRYI